MRKFAFLVLLLLALSWVAAAQSYPKADIFGGYSLMHIDTEGATGSSICTGCDIKSSYSGWEAALQLNASRWLGLKADFSGHYGTPISGPGLSGIPSANFYNFLFGPVITFRGEKVSPYAHALFGANRAAIGSTTGFTGGSDTAFAMAFGGGLDVKVASKFSIRLGQFDYLYTKHDICAIIGAGTGCTISGHQNNFRFAAGVVLHAGGQ